MSLESVRAWLAEHAPDLPLIEVAESTATVDDRRRGARRRAGPDRQDAGGAGPATTVFLLVARGDARLDNGKTKAEFGARPRMLGPEETLALTGHPVGGVCPFGLATPLPVYCDVSLQGLRPRLSGRRLAQQLGRGDAGAAVRAGRRALGRPLPAAGRGRIDRRRSPLLWSAR